MVKYLIDVNLPYYFSLWNSEPFIHQKDINDQSSGEEIWQYAENNNLTIITKDVNFSNKILLHEPPPKVIHIRFGNMKMNEFYATMK
jgi:predicted nuclease of predicted toxin-antitoxin system